MINKLNLDSKTINKILNEFKEFCEKNNYIYPENLINSYLKNL